MENKKLLIVGIDPGITTAYAVLGIEGDLIHLNSFRQLDLKMLISEIIEFGKVVLVGTDKSKVPRLVEEFATKLGANVMCPSEDLKIEEDRYFGFIDKKHFDTEKNKAGWAKKIIDYYKREKEQLISR